MVGAVVRGDDAATLATPANRIAADDPAWTELSRVRRGQAAVTADFTEERRFAFRRAPTLLHGEARVSSDRGLSLHYSEPEDQTVIVDANGSLVRSASGDLALPSDPRASAANFALLHLLRLDLPPLATAFELYGRHTGRGWTIVLVPREPDLRRTLGQITVEGEGPEVRRIELRRSATQRVEIHVEPPRSSAAFTPEELRRYFR
jgi:hypothetical protein